ncbi:unnamed protein product [Dicrocoelium dendriticum]|nr:unnamed protein product [Dicrocoelium dendriticum]
MDSRCIIRLCGASSTEFLQGLLTNDMRSISRLGSFMYSLFLNVKGRVMSDVFVYHTKTVTPGEETFLLEVDKADSASLLRYLSSYNLRKRVSISLQEDLSVWVALPSTSINSLVDSNCWLPVEPPSMSQNGDLLFYAPDPRGLPGWSGRILMKSHTQANAVFTAANESPSVVDVYHQMRWRMGLPEGASEIIRNETLPLEANADLSGGISFSKGCYVGQELTARTRFTGVVRRRFVPVRLCSADQLVSNLSPGCHFTNAVVTVETSAEQRLSKPIGWLRAVWIPHEGPINFIEGLALLRLTDVSSSPSQIFTALSDPDPSKSCTLLVTPYAPNWWPKEVAPELQRLGE